MFKSVFLHAGEHGLRRLPDESGDEGEEDGVRDGRGGHGGGEVEENARNKGVEEDGREKQLGPHLFVFSLENIFIDSDEFVVEDFQEHKQRIQKTDLSTC